VYFVCKIHLKTGEKISQPCAVLQLCPWRRGKGTGGLGKQGPWELKGIVAPQTKLREIFACFVTSLLACISAESPC
jgi:hypothetical protein